MAAKALRIEPKAPRAAPRSSGGHVIGAATTEIHSMTPTEKQAKKIRAQANA